MSDKTRRQFLAAAGIAGVGSIAGCLDGVTGDSDEETLAQASFFVFGDFAAQIVGDTATTSTLVPIGQHGHGWEPGLSVREDIRNTRLLVYGPDGFQPWIGDIIGDLEADGTEVTAIEASADVDLLEVGEDAHDHDDDQDDHDDDQDDHDDDQDDGHDDDQDDGHDDEQDDSHDEDQEDDQDDGHDEDQEDDQDDGHDEDQDDGHDHGQMDPHFWMDPLRASEAVDTIRSGLVEVDPDNADSYDENARAYQEELDALHEEIDSLVADANKETIVLAGHDAFSYFGARYGIEFVSVTGLSPDDQSTTRDLDRARQIIDEHDIEYVCADPLESQEAAERLVEDTAAAEILPLTSMPGLTEEWDDNDWGYLEIIENVNLPTLERALDA
ncbi:MAG: metal ABC transporter substrate-binding protein [Halapricum sp.]